LSNLIGNPLAIVALSTQSIADTIERHRTLLPPSNATATAAIVD
jgi:hypothetical protein